MKVYYAHSMHLYNTRQELRDIQQLEGMGFEVFNPNNPEVQKEVEDWKALYEKHVEAHTGTNISVMDLFKHYIDSCDILAYRSHVDLKIPSGVMFEINYAAEKGKYIIELPTLTEVRELSHYETVKYLRYNGQR